MPQTEQENSKAYGIYMPAYIGRRDDLTADQKIVLSKILMLAEKEGYCYASNRYLAELTFNKPDTISKMVSGFKKKGLLNVKVVRRETKQVVIRIITPNYDKLVHPPVPPSGTSRMQVGHTTEITTTLLRNVKKKDFSNKNKINKSRQITKLIDVVTKTLEVPKLDGTVKSNRYMANHLLNDLEKANITIPQFIEALKNTRNVRGNTYIKHLSDMRGVRNNLSKILKMGEDYIALGYRPGYEYEENGEYFEVDDKGNKIINFKLPK